MAVTIKDVAALAGVSPSTVSRTCKDHPSISNETKEKVRLAMAQLGYEPNLQSSGSSLLNLKQIGIIFPSSPRETYENSFYLEATRGINQFCNSHHTSCTIITGQNDDEILNSIEMHIKNNRIDGFIVLYSKQDDIILDYLNSEGILFVLIGKAHQFANQTIYVDNDNLLAGQEATEYLYALGHKKIAYLGSKSILLFSADRKSGYQFALNKLNLPFDSRYCIETPDISVDRCPELHNLLELEDRPTAIIVSDDILAVSLARVCIQHSLSIPEDISILSFNNSLFARLTSPQLTSIDINSFQLGIEAASQLLNHIENPNLMATKTIVPHSMIERDSCRSITTDD